MSMDVIYKFRDIVCEADTRMLTEARGHLDHPEDYVFTDGTAGALMALNALKQTVVQPETVTIKWDGYPALIFGHNEQGEFVICDKHMFNKAGGQGRVTSPAAFREYDRARGADRSDLADTIDLIWPGLKKASARQPGYIWGDLLFNSNTNPLREQSGLYVFQPNEVTYTVDPASDVGKAIQGKVAAVAVHQHIPAAAANTDAAVSLDGGTGKLQNNSNVAILGSKMPITPELKLDPKLVAAAESAVKKYGADANFISNPENYRGFTDARGWYTVYINSKIASGNLQNMVQDWHKFWADRVDKQRQSGRVSDTKLAKITEFFTKTDKSLTSAMAIWVALHNLKMSLVPQLDKAAEDSPVKGYLDGKLSQEGFVANGVKLVDRLVFSRLNFARSAARAAGTP